MVQEYLVALRWRADAERFWMEYRHRQIVEFALGIFSSVIANAASGAHNAPA